MNAFTSEVELLLAAWERGQSLSPARRGLLLLGFACPEAGEAQLADAPLGWRNCALAQLRRRWIGPVLEAYAECPACGDRLELAIPAEKLLADFESAHTPASASLQAGGLSIEFRPPTTRDLIELEDQGGGAEALAAACVVSASDANRPLDRGQLTAELVERLAHGMLQLDPLAEFQVDLQCHGCGHGWPMILDLPSFLWKEISVRARRLLLEVDALARAYGWAERDILAMSGFRRQCYLELLGS